MLCHRSGDRRYHVLHPIQWVEPNWVVCMHGLSGIGALFVFTARCCLCCPAFTIIVDPTVGRTFDWLKQLMVTVVVHLHASASSKVDGDSTCFRKWSQHCKHAEAAAAAAVAVAAVAAAHSYICCAQMQSWERCFKNCAFANWQWTSNRIDEY
jgi:TRAP-type C4-dicarboxylate transport system permease small subunit